MDIHLSDADHETPAPPSRALGGMSVVLLTIMVLLTIIATTLVVIAVNSQRLIVEQQRATCYARLAWLDTGDEEPFGVGRSVIARNCDGSSPVVEYQDTP